MKLKDILKKKTDIESDGHIIENNIIRGADIYVVGHFGNIVTMNVWTDNCCLLHDYNNTDNLGLMIYALTELFDLTEEDGYKFNQFKDIPCRIISDGWGTRVLGFGHFMKDKFVYTDDFVKINERG